MTTVSAKKTRAKAKVRIPKTKTMIDDSYESFERVTQKAIDVCEWCRRPYELCYCCAEASVADLY